MAEQAGFDRVAAKTWPTWSEGFDLHKTFTNELTQFFTELNQWQSRYDLDADEVQFLAGVLVDYVHEQLTEIERMTRPIARTLEEIFPQVAALLPALRSGLAVRVEEAGPGQNVAAAAASGHEVADWKHLEQWFSAQPAGVKADGLTQQAVAPCAPLRQVSPGCRGSDWARRQGGLTSCDWRASSTKRFSNESHQISAAAFGLRSCACRRMYADSDDPAHISHHGRTAPRVVPVGDAGERGETPRAA